MRRFALAVVVTLAALASLGVAAPGARAADPIDTVDLTNAERHTHGLGPLTVAPDLVAEAQRHAADMAAAGALWHTPDLATRVTGWKRLGENVGRGPTVQAIHAGFMASPSHRANVLQAAYTQIGVGTVATNDGRLYVSVLYRLPSNARTTTRTVPASIPRATTSAAAPTTKSTVPVQVQGATVTRGAAAETKPATQLASGALPIGTSQPINQRHVYEWFALALLVTAAAGHATTLVARRRATSVRR